jgi:hypothetical protein
MSESQLQGPIPDISIKNGGGRNREMSTVRISVLYLGRALSLSASAKIFF